MSKQRSTSSKQLPTLSKMRNLSKGRNFSEKVVRHCYVFGNKVERCFDIVAKNGNNIEATFDFVAFDNVASTVLLVWTGFYGRMYYRSISLLYSATVVKRKYAKFSSVNHCLVATKQSYLPILCVLRQFFFVPNIHSDTHRDIQTHRSRYVRHL